MISALLIAAQLTLLAPEVTVTNAPLSLSAELQDLWIQRLSHDAGCADANRPAVDDAVGAELFKCADNAECIAKVGAAHAATSVILASVVRVFGAYQVQMIAVDVATKKARDRVQGKFETPDQVTTGIKSGITKLCKQFIPTAVDEDLPIDLSRVTTPAQAAVAPTPALPDFDLPLPPADAAAAKPAVAAKDPVVPAAGPLAVQTPPAPPAPGSMVLQPPPPPAPSRGQEPWLGVIPAPKSASARRGTLIAAGVLAGAGVLGGIFGATTLSAATSRNQATDLAAYNSAQSSLQTRGTMANVAVGAAGLAAITGAIFYFGDTALFGVDR